MDPRLRKDDTQVNIGLHLLELYMAVLGMGIKWMVERKGPNDTRSGFFLHIEILRG